MQHLGNEVAGLREKNQPITRAWLTRLVDRVVACCALPGGIIWDNCIARCAQVRKIGEADGQGAGESLLNSFFIGDLQAVADAASRGDLGCGFAAFLAAGAERQRRRADDLNRALAQAQEAHADAYWQQRRQEDRSRGVRDELNALQSELDAKQSDLADERARLGRHCPALDADADAHEKSAPWMTEEWRRARESVFPAALDVHRAFLEHHAAQVMSNIGLASDWLQGRKLPEDVARLALDSPCLAVPVLSTTFASVPRMLRDAGAESIGWL